MVYISASLDQESKVLYKLFLLNVKLKGYQEILKLRCKPLALTSYKVFLKNKKSSGTSLPGSFSAWFLKQNICFIRLTDQISLSSCLYLMRYLAICILKLLTRLWHHIWNQPYLSNQAFFSTWPKIQDKNLNILRTKKAFKVKQKAFFIMFKGLSLKQIKQFFFGR